MYIHLKSANVHYKSVHMYSEIDVHTFEVIWFFFTFVVNSLLLKSFMNRSLFHTWVTLFPLTNTDKEGWQMYEKKYQCYIIWNQYYVYGIYLVIHMII